MIENRKIGLPYQLVNILLDQAKTHVVSFDDEVRKRLWWSLTDGGVLSDPEEHLRKLATVALDYSVG